MILPGCEVDSKGYPINPGSGWITQAMRYDWIKDGVIETLKVRIELLENEIKRLKARLQ